MRSFTFGGRAVLQELFLALGQLPRLETLSLRADESQVQMHLEDPIIVPDYSFPSLRQLDLYQLYASAIARICVIAPLFCRLVSASIIYKGKPSGHGFQFSHRFNRSEVAMTCLGADSPHIEYLTVLPEGECPSEFLVSWTIVDKLRLLPLKYLRVGRINLKLDVSSRHLGGDQPTWDDLLTAVPQLEELHMDTYYISLNELQLVGSRLPELRLLVFWQVTLQEAGQQLKAAGATTQRIVLRSWSYFGGAEVQDDEFQSSWQPRLPADQSEVYAAARFLYGIWPNVICETQNVSYWPRRYPPDEESGERLNKAIGLLKLGVDPEGSAQAE
ncbi:hypothetical protein FRC12_006973 [Ceratobasidium sp. 428]|nr:hypothetical protein FRC12_006973 [Ceratobasidium sp. 428]